MANSPVTGSELEKYRKSRNLSQVAIGEMLGVSGPTVNRWEKDEQEIPGPAQLLLRMLIHGEMPFGERDPQAEAMEVEHFWKLKLSLADWHKLEGLAQAGGFATVRDYLLSLIQEDLEEARRAEAEGVPGRWGRSLTSDQAPVDGLALVAEAKPGDGAGGDGAGDDVGAHTDAAAEVFAKQNPLPPAAEAGAPSGTTAGRKGVIYKRIPKNSDTGVRKR